MILLEIKQQNFTHYLLKHQIGPNKIEQRKLHETPLESRFNPYTEKSVLLANQSKKKSLILSRKILNLLIISKLSSRKDLHVAYKRHKVVSKV